MKVVVFCQGTTAAMRSGGFPAPDEPLDAGTERRLAPSPIGAFDRIVASPSLAARQTAGRLGGEPVPVAALRDIDHGSWTGRSFADIHAEHAEALAGWLARPWDGTPDGETFAAVCTRVAGWIAAVPDSGTALAIVTPPMVVRAILTATIGIPAEAVMRLDVAPLTAATLSRHRGWRLQRLGETAFA